MSLLNIGISALSSYKQALQTTGHNIANTNTPGYSRQEVIMDTNNPQFKGAGWIGSGVGVQQIRRIHDEFLTAEIRNSTFEFHQLDTYKGNIEQVNRLVADERTGLTPVLNNYFASLQNAADDPAFVPTREVVLGEAKALADRFNTIQNRFSNQNVILNGQMGAMASEINALAAGIGSINEKIAFAAGDIVTAPPNDLIDKRDELVRQLAEYIDIDVAEVDGQMNIGIGNGHTLVLGFEAARVEAVAGINDPQRVDIRFVSKTSDLIVTDQIAGGKLGGAIAFRKESLDTSINALGRIAFAISSEMNKQHVLGLDLEGNFGENMFTDFNDPELARTRVEPSAFNALPSDRHLSVFIEDTGELTVSDYEIKFKGPKDQNYQVVRLSDNQIVADSSLTGTFPDTVEFDGLKVQFDGGSFQAGDRFQVQPLRTAAEDFKSLIERPAALALGFPVKAQSSLGNLGSGFIDQGEMISKDTAIFDELGKLSPPLVIRFEAEDRYSILDNTDPLRPRSLMPPMENLDFSPGIANKMFPEDTGQTQITSMRGFLPLEAFVQRTYEDDETPLNGFYPTRLTFTRTDEFTGKQTDDLPVSFDIGTSVREMAEQLNVIDGVQARASTTMQISNFTAGDPPYNPDNPTQIWLNGYELTLNDYGIGQNTFAEGYDQEVPEPLTPNFIASRINDHYKLQEAGISAKSDGEKIVITALHGDNLTIEMKGDRNDPSLSVPGDSFDVSNGDVMGLTPTGASLRGLLNNNTGFNFNELGPYTFDFEVEGFGQKSIELTEAYATGEEVIAAFEAAIKEQIPNPAEVEVSIDARGNVSFQLMTKLEGWSNNDSEKITIGGKLDIVMDDGISVRSEPPNGNLFPEFPEAKPIFQGFQFSIDGRPEAGDEFTIEYNSDGVSDNRNVLTLAALEVTDLINKDNGGQTFNEAYGSLVETVGVKTRQIMLNTEAAEAVLQQVQLERDAIAGVNLDEEAARLIEFETAYNASAQVIKVAQELFDTLLATFR